MPQLLGVDVEDPPQMEQEGQTSQVRQSCFSTITMAVNITCV